MSKSVFFMYSEAINFMGYKTFEKKTKEQIAKHIRNVAKNTGSVIITKHASVRMKQRRVSSQEIYECLRNGVMRRVPEPNEKTKSLECLMERYVAGRELGIIVAICDEDPDVVVVTVFSVN